MRCLIVQVKHGFWFYPVLGITEVYKHRFPPVAMLREVLKNNGCTTVQSYVQTERVLMDYAMYSDVEGSLQPTWRRADSG